MSGLVRTYSAWSRVQSRSSRLLSPSCVESRTSSPSERSEAHWSWASALVGATYSTRRPALAARTAGGLGRGRAPAAGTPATCPRPSRSRRRRAHPPTRPRRPRPGGPTAARPRARRRPRARAGGVQSGHAADRAGAGRQQLQVGQPVVAATGDGRSVEQPGGPRVEVAGRAVVDAGSVAGPRRHGRLWTAGC